jgi:PadR family transcriptional regulator PadR
MRGIRCRWYQDGAWHVRARIERFIEPALLLVLAQGPMHGYDLLERVGDLTGDDRGLDLGNLYRVLRSLEEEGFVRSTWHAELQGPAKRVYEITDSGRGLLGTWADALRRTRADIDGFLTRYEEGR